MNHSSGHYERLMFGGLAVIVTAVLVILTWSVLNDVGIKDSLPKSLAIVVVFYVLSYISGYLMMEFPNTLRRWRDDRR